ncbi:MAG: resolvase [Pedobacter sp.]|nr:MAG: resolvase [Pedobacter sp.]
MKSCIITFVLLTSLLISVAQQVRMVQGQIVGLNTSKVYLYKTGLFAQGPQLVDSTRLSGQLFYFKRLINELGAFFMSIDNAGMPDADTLTIGIFATLAQHERELISSRTKSALQAKIAQGAVLGKPENMTPAAQAKGASANRQRAIDNPESRKAEGLAKELRRNKKTCTEIADKLNQFGFKTAQGCEFYPMQVKRLLDRVTMK